MKQPPKPEKPLDQGVLNALASQLARDVRTIKAHADRRFEAASDAARRMRELVREAIALHGQTRAEIRTLSVNLTALAKLLDKFSREH